MEELKKLREKESLTLNEMAFKLGMSVSLYQKLEYGLRTPSANVLRKIKQTFPDVDVNIFFN